MSLPSMSLPWMPLPRMSLSWMALNNTYLSCTNIKPKGNNPSTSTHSDRNVDFAVLFFWARSTTTDHTFVLSKFRDSISNTKWNRIKEHNTILLRVIIDNVLYHKIMPNEKMRNVYDSLYYKSILQIFN